METKQLSSIPETMLVPLWAKATETANKGGLIDDKFALSIIKQVDYDFSKFKKSVMSQVGCCVRADLIDKETQSFLSRHPDAVVIQLGAGIDARYQRIGSPKVTHWFDLDLKESLDIRKVVLPETERNTYIEMSMFNYKWINRVKAYSKPVLIIIEGVLMYFEPDEVKKFFRKLCDEFKEATVLMDILLYWGVKHSKHHDALSKLNNNAEFLWSVLHAREMEKWHTRLHLGKEYYMSDYDQKRFPWLMRMLYKIPYFYKRGNQRIVRMEIG